MGLGVRPSARRRGHPGANSLSPGTVDSSQLAVRGRARPLLPPGGLTGSGRPTPVIVAAGAGLVLRACVCLCRASACPVGLRVRLRAPCACPAVCAWCPSRRILRPRRVGGGG